MLIKSLSIQNFRNHAATSVELCDGVNVFVGKNAQGKTNLLEAIYMTCVGRGFRSNKDKDAIMFGKDFARVKTVAMKRYGKVDVDIIVAQGKQIKINSIPISKMGELMGTMTCVFFNPDELKLVKEAPADRRRFMDIDLSQMDKTYFYNLLKYNKILKQRNALLKSMNIASADELRSLDIWDEELCKAGELIISRRRIFCEELNKSVGAVHKAIAPDEVVEIELETVQNCSTWNNFLGELRKSRDKDLRLRTTTVGPHRDDIAISINGKDVRGFASQGQQRTAALSMKIAELGVFEKATGEKPVLLLDDVFSELDEGRRVRLLELIGGWQTVITATEFDEALCPGVKLYQVHNGAVTC